jgi:chromosome segregation ATPase
MFGSRRKTPFGGDKGGDNRNDLVLVHGDQNGALAKAGRTIDAETSEDLEKEAANQAVSPQLNNYVEGVDALAVQLSGLAEALNAAQLRTEHMQVYSKTLLTEAASARKARGQVDSLSRENMALSDEVFANRNAIHDLSEEIKNLRLTQADLISELDAANRALDKANGDIARLGDVELQQKRKLETIRSESKTKAEQLENALKDIERMKVKRDDLDNKLGDTQRDLVTVRSQLAELEIEHREVSKLQKSMVVERDRYVSERKLMSSRLAEMDTDLSKWKLKGSTLETKNAELYEQLSSERYASDKDRQNYHASSKLFEREKADLIGKLKTLKDRNNALEAECEKAKKASDQNAKALEITRSDLSKATVSISEINLKYSSDMITVDELRDKVKMLEGRLADARTQQLDASEYESQAKSAQIRAEKLQQKLSAYQKKLAARSSGTTNLGDSGSFEPIAADVAVENADIQPDAAKH